MNLTHLRRSLAIIGLAALPFTFAHAESAQTAMITLASSQNVDTTVANLSQAFTARGMTIFTVIDHQAAARAAGLDMQAAKVIVYGTPKAGTPLMQKDPHFALKLPLKVLVTENQQGQTEVVFESTRQLLQNSNITPAEVQNTLAQAEKLIANTVSAANQPAN